MEALRTKSRDFTEQSIKTRYKFKDVGLKDGNDVIKLFDFGSISKESINVDDVIVTYQSL